MPPLSPTERALSARLAAHESWAATADRATRTAPGRAAFLARFERQVDPDGTMNPTERALRADSARKAFYARIQLMSAQARRARAHARELETQIESAGGAHD